MAEENKQEKQEQKTEEKKEEIEKEQKPAEVPKKKPTKEKPKQPETPKKEEASIRGKDLSISTKHSIAICNFIRGNKIEDAAEKLRKVIDKKIAVPMKGEIPHRKGIMGGRYPEKAAKEFIKLLKSLAANSSVNGLENPYIETAKADIAARPYRRFGSKRFKRTNVLLVAKEKKVGKKKKEKEKQEEKKEKEKGKEEVKKEGGK